MIPNRKRKTDPYTFDASPAGVNLVSILENYDNKIKLKVRRILMGQLLLLKQVDAVKDMPDGLKITMLMLVHKSFHDKVSTFPETVMSHMECVEATVYKDLFHKNGGGRKPKEKADV
jgi:hypothetical protein